MALDRFPPGRDWSENSVVPLALPVVYTHVMTVGAGTAYDVAVFSFEEFVGEVEPRLRRALVASYGPDRGREATAEALAWAWEHRDRLAGIDRPLPYLYRVAQTRVRRRRLRILYQRSVWTDPWVEPKLDGALRALTAQQRTAVVLVHGFDWTVAEVADLLGIRVTTAKTHLARGLAHLRDALEVNADD